MDCPITILGSRNGLFVFRDPEGQPRYLSAAQLHRRFDLLSLFLGDDKWLRENFPKEAAVQVRTPVGKLMWSRRTVDFRTDSAAVWLANACLNAPAGALAEDA